MTWTTVARGVFTLCLASILAMPMFVMARGVEPASSAKTFVQQIYGSYLGNSGQNARGVPLEDAATVKRYFSAGLASLILDHGAEARKPGELPILGADTFIGHQAWDIANLVVDVKESGAKATAIVRFTNAGNPEKVVLDLLKVGESWRIADIAWDSGTLRGLYRKK